MIKMFDRDNNNTIELHEFVQLWDFLGSWRTVFDRFDTDRSGNISPSELTLALQQLGYQFSQHFVPILMQKFDFHKTGSLQFDGFVHSILMIRRLTAAFQPYDTYSSLYLRTISRDSYRKYNLMKNMCLKISFITFSYI